MYKTTHGCIQKNMYRNILLIDFSFINMNSDSQLIDTVIKLSQFLPLLNGYVNLNNLWMTTKDFWNGKVLDYYANF